MSNRTRPSGCSIARQKVTVGHKTGTGDLNAKGQQIGCNDIGFVLLPGGRTYSIAVFVKDSEENNQANSKLSLIFPVSFTNM